MNIWQKIITVVGNVFTGFILACGISYLVGVVALATKSNWEGSLVCLVAGMVFVGMAKVNGMLKRKMVVMAGKTK